MKLEIERKPAEEGRFAGISEVTGHRGDVKVKVATENVHRSATLVTAFDLLFDSLECHCAIQLRNRAVFVVTTPLELATAAAMAWIVRLDFRLISLERGMPFSFFTSHFCSGISPCKSHSGGLFAGATYPTNCTFAGNTAGSEGGGIWTYSGNVLNCAVWANAPDGLVADNRLAVVLNSNLQEPWIGQGSGNISIDPRFIDADGPDNPDVLASPTAAEGFGIARALSLE